MSPSCLASCLATQSVIVYTLLYGTHANKHSSRSTAKSGALPTLLLAHTQVPAHVYDRSTFIFITAFCLDVLNMLFERHTTKIDFVLYPAFIKGIASTTNVLARFGTPVIAFSTTGRL